MKETIDVALRALEPEDAALAYVVENDEQAWKYGDTVAPLSMHQLMEYAVNYDSDPFKAGQLRMIVVDKSKGRSLGIADLYDISQRHGKAFCAIYILPAMRNCGVGSSAIRLLKSYCKHHLFLNRLFAYVGKTNIPSLSVFRKAGFSEIACIPEWIRDCTGFKEVYMLTTKL